jgi:hypothetical protein
MRAIYLLIVILIFSLTLSAQSVDDKFEMPGEGNGVNGGVGVTWIDGKAFTQVTIAPDLAFGKFGIGLNIELLFNNEDGLKFRETGWDDGAGWLRAIRYIRWGHKYDPLYIRLGTLNGTSLGNGFIMGYYSNDAYYDYRKIGLVLDINRGAFGIETMTSSLQNLEIIGTRLYVRPLHSSGLFIIKNLELGGTFVGDFDPDERKATDDGVKEWGIDITLPIVKTDYFRLAVYGDFAKIIDYGSGAVVGIRSDLPGLVGLFSLSAKLERRFNGDQFLPNYFNSLYELERKPLDAAYYSSELAGTATKEEYLATVKSSGGIFGELAGHILGKIKLGGSYQSLNGVKNSGILHLEAKAFDLIPSIRAQISYDKVGIETFEDARTLDYRSLATAQIGYQIYPYVYANLRYRWNFIYDESSGKYKPQERFEPNISFAYNF